MIVYLDSLALLFRSYYAIPDLVSKDGEPTGALFGLTNTLLRIAAELEPDHIVACFDRPEMTYRQIENEEYKANRETPEDDMIEQIEQARDVLKSYGVHIVESAGHEADDLLGTLALQDADDGKDVIIVTCDGDLLQLTTHKNIRVYLLQKGLNDFSLFDEKETEKRNGYPAKNIIDYKGLAGDSSDNIKGVKGIGDKTATRLIKTHGNLDEIYKALEEGKIKETPRIQTLLKNEKASAFESRELATIHTDIKIKRPHTRSKVWKEKIKLKDAEETLRRLSFLSLLSRLKKLAGGVNEDEASVDPMLLEEAKIMLWIWNSSLTEISEEDVYSYTDTSNIKDAISFLERELTKGGLIKIWEEIEKPLTPVIKKMEKEGILYDKKRGEMISKEQHKRLEELSKEIYKIAGKEFNIKSPKQLSEVLFNDLGIATGKKRTTKESVLISIDHPIIKPLLEYRRLEKLRSTYVDAFPKYIKEDGRIHATFNQAGTTTGRISSTSPNMQNIPPQARPLFIAREGYELISIDYSQMELRIAAMLSQDKTLLDVFKNNGDIHTRVACEIFNTDKPTKKQRQDAKTINFGILYGMGATSLKTSLGVSQNEAQEFLDRYKKALPKLFDYLQTIKLEARENGFITTAFGRVRNIEGIRSSLAFIKAQAERMAANSVIQGTGADVIKTAMVRIDEVLGDDVKLILQIHDELLFEAKEGTDMTEVKKIMEGVYTQGGVKLIVDEKRGKVWGELV